MSELRHYGILGMKWGVRRTPEELGRARGDKKSSWRVDKKKNNKNTQKTKTSKSSKKSKDLEEKKLDPKKMSDEELRKHINRIKMEQEYEKLTSPPNEKKITKGQEITYEILKSFGTTMARTLAASTGAHLSKSAYAKSNQKLDAKADAAKEAYKAKVAKELADKKAQEDKREAEQAEKKRRKAAQDAADRARRRGRADRAVWYGTRNPRLGNRGQ